MQRTSLVPFRYLLIVATTVLLWGCAGERIILLPDEEGAHGHVEVRTDDHVLVLSEPLTSASVGLLGDIKGESADAAQVEQEFEAVLSAMPPPPQSFRLYFREGTTRLMPESEPVMHELLEAIEEHPVADIQVTGHTDRVGTVKDNDELASNRAGFVRRMLIQGGLADRFIRAVGRGEREPLVETKDEVEEPRNRRVEVLVR